MGEAFKYQSSWKTENILTSTSVLALGSGSFIRLNHSNYYLRGNTSITYDSANLLSSGTVGTRTIVLTRDAYSKVSSYTDGTHTWTITRASNGGLITGVAVT